MRCVCSQTAVSSVSTPVSETNRPPPPTTTTWLLDDHARRRRRPCHGADASPGSPPRSSARSGRPSASRGMSSSPVRASHAFIRQSTQIAGRTAATDHQEFQQRDVWPCDTISLLIKLKLVVKIVSYFVTIVILCLFSHENEKVHKRNTCE